MDELDALYRVEDAPGDLREVYRTVRYGDNVDNLKRTNNYGVLSNDGDGTIFIQTGEFADGTIILDHLICYDMEMAKIGHSEVSEELVPHNGFDYVELGQEVEAKLDKLTV